MKNDDGTEMLQETTRREGILPAALFDRDTSLLDRVITLLCYVAAAVAVASVLISLAATGYSVFMRYVIGVPVTWIDELSGYLVVAIVMFGAAEALRRDDHIRVDLLTASLTGLPLRIMQIVWMLFIIAMMACLLKSAWSAVVFSYDFGLYSEGYLELPMWVPQSMLLAGSALTLLAAIGQILKIVLAGNVQEVNDPK